MGELVYRSNVHQDWVSLIFLINLLLVSALYYLDPVRLRRLIRFYATTLYISKHSSEKNLNFLSPFNLVSFLIVINSLCLFFLSFSSQINKPIVFAFEYYYLLVGLFIFLSLRFFFIKFIVGQLRLLRALKLSYFRSFTHHVQFALLFLIILFIDFYANLPTSISIVIFLFLGSLWFIYQARIIISIFNSRPRDVVYIFIYLCTLKTIPWYWFYKLLIESEF